jgi:hypothetical protein
MTRSRGLLFSRVAVFNPHTKPDRSSCLMVAQDVIVQQGFQHQDSRWQSWPSSILDIQTDFIGASRRSRTGAC